MLSNVFSLIIDDDALLDCVVKPLLFGFALDVHLDSLLIILEDLTVADYHLWVWIGAEATCIECL